MSVLAKPGKSKHKPESAAETLEQLESLSDRLGNWIAENAMLVLGAILVPLVLAGGYGLIDSQREGAREEASAALAEVENDYLLAMGTSPDAILIEEPANPETARRVREEYVTRYQEVAAQFPGTLEGRLSSLEAGSLQQMLGRSDDAIATWQAALDGSSSAVRGLLLERIAGAHEAADRWAEAAKAHEAAAAIEDFPVRYLALTEAIRCHAEAGDSARALELYDQLQSEAPDHQVAPTLQAMVSELRASR